MVTRNSLSTEAVGEPSSSEHAHGLGHLSKALPVRDDFGADNRLSIDRGIIHLIDEGLHRNDITRDLLLKLQRMSASLSLV